MTIIPFLNKVNDLILNPLILLLFAISLVIFVYGIVKFLSLDVTDSARKEARSSIIWGIVGMLIMFSVYGVINLVLETFGTNPTEINYPLE